MRDGVLVLFYWILNFEAVMLDIGYSPALRDPAMRDGILDIEYLGCYIGHWTFRVGYWILSILAAPCGTDYRAA